MRRATEMLHMLAGKLQPPGSNVNVKFRECHGLAVTMLFKAVKLTVPKDGAEEIPTTWTIFMKSAICHTEAAYSQMF